MYKIGEFSKITNLTIKALHYYDEENILTPSYRDENNYRFYNEQDLKKAELIIFLKNLDFSIKEIKDVINNYVKEEDITYFLKEKKEIIKIKIKKQKEILEQLEKNILPNKGKKEIDLKYHIEEKEYEKIIVISIKYRGSYSDIGKYIGNLYREAKSNVSGPPINLFYDESYMEDAQIELCLPLKKKIYSEKYEVKEIEKIRSISVIHNGSYETINYAYKALIDYAKENNLELEVPSRLIYHKGPGMIFKGNPNNYITEVIIPIKEI